MDPPNSLATHENLVAHENLVLHATHEKLVDYTKNALNIPLQFVVYVFFVKDVKDVYFKNAALGDLHVQYVKDVKDVDFRMKSVCGVCLFGQRCQRCLF